MPVRKRLTGARLARPLSWCLLLTVSTLAQGEHLPIKLYTAADGLPSSAVRCVVRDSHDLLWFCTSEGLSSFDGYSFTNYGVEQGLPDAGVVDFLEARDGEYWVATNSGISRFLPGSSLERDDSTGKRRQFFEVYRLPPDNQLPPRRPVRLAEAPDGRIWYLTNTGLLRFDHASKRFEPIDTERGSTTYTTLFHDRDGSLWLGAESGLFRRLPDGRVEAYGKAEGLPTWPDGPARIGAVFRDRDGRLWVGTWLGLCRLSAHPSPGKHSVEQVYTPRDGLNSRVVMALFQSQDGTVWVGTEFGLSRLIPGSGKTPEHFRTYTARRGLDLAAVGGPGIARFAEDSRKNLWMVGYGAMRLARNGFTTYGLEDGLAALSVASLLEDSDGRPIAVTGNPQPRFLNVFDGERFVSIVPRFPEAVTVPTWGSGRIIVPDHSGAWWVATGQGICRYAAVRRAEDLARTLPEKVFTTRDGLPGDNIYGLYEDSRGDVWISVIGPDVVTRWSRSDGSIRNFRQAEGGRLLGTPTAFAEDRAGDIWMSFYWRDLARYREGRFEVFTAEEGLPEGVVTSLLVDHAGRLWVGSSQGGLARIDDPAAARPRFSVYTTRSGLASNEIACLTEDVWGRIYAGNGRGIDRLDPETGRVRHYGEAEGVRYGLPPQVAFRDRQGSLWFGAARLTPVQDEPSEPAPPIRITQVRVRGAERPVSALGERRVSGLRLKSVENQVQIDFASLNFGVSETIRYQYKLEGSEKDWGPLVDSRSVNYAVLSPGSYRFLVRAVNTGGLASVSPASVEFMVLPPFWMRWWFWAATLSGLGLAAVSAHRYRLRQVLQLERVRTRIATDLHDDIGSSLTQIAVLSEVVRRNIGGENGSALQLAKIADLSRELVESMSDIVWSINPRRDHVSDLAYRMRRFGSDVLTARDIDFDFATPEGGEHIAVRTEVRRQTFLIFKECIHNVVRHAECNRVQVILGTGQRRLVLRINDNGKGFAAPRNGHGHGLASMKQRAREIGGELHISSEPGRGATVTLSVPLDHKRLPAAEKEPT
jgi:signal transduction histidine kinase/ligand-binding sensor domain-containing protein